MPQALSPLSVSPTTPFHPPPPLFPCVFLSLFLYFQPSVLQASRLDNCEDTGATRAETEGGEQRKEKLEEKDVSPEMPGTSMVWRSNKKKRINSKLLEFFYPELTLPA